MYAQWRSVEDFQAMRQDPAPLPFLQEALAIATFEPGMDEVVQTFAPLGEGAQHPGRHTGKREASSQVASSLGKAQNSSNGSRAAAQGDPDHGKQGAAEAFGSQPWCSQAKTAAPISPDRKACLIVQASNLNYATTSVS